MLGANFGVLLYGDVSMMCFVSVEISVNRKVPKFANAGKICCNLPKIQEKRPNLWVFRQKDANGIANS